MSKLDDCLLTIEKNVKLSDKSAMKIHSESKQQIKDLFNELIGENARLLNEGTADAGNLQVNYQNMLRQSLRKKVQEL